MEVINDWMLGVMGALTRQAMAVLELQNQHTEMRQEIEEKAENILQAFTDKVQKCEEQIHRACSV